MKPIAHSVQVIVASGISNKDGWKFYEHILSMETSPEKTISGNTLSSQQKAGIVSITCQTNPDPQNALIAMPTATLPGHSHKERHTNISNIYINNFFS